MKHRPVLSCCLLLLAHTVAAELPDGYWPVEATQPILDSRLEVTLAPDLDHLSPAELQAVNALLAAGQVMQTLYEQQLHAQALAAKQTLDELHSSAADPGATRNLLDLYYLFKGPVATTLDNERLPFLPVGSPDPARPSTRRASRDRRSMHSSIRTRKPASLCSRSARSSVEPAPKPLPAISRGWTSTPASRHCIPACARSSKRSKRTRPRCMQSRTRWPTPRSSPRRGSTCRPPPIQSRRRRRTSPPTCATAAATCFPAITSPAMPPG